MIKVIDIIFTVITFPIILIFAIFIYAFTMAEAIVDYINFMS